MAETRRGWEGEETMDWRKEAERLIERQQAGKEGTATWMVGEQLKDICRREPAAAELLARDLELPEMSIQEAEKKIKAWADKHKVGNFACVIPQKAEEILREFYGLGKPEEKDERAGEKRVNVRLEDFF